MAVRDLPIYTSRHPNYIYVTDVDKFVEDFYKDKPNRIAVDTETYYNTELDATQGVITRFIKGNPNNVPFGVSLYWGEQGYWVTEGLEKLKPILEDKSVEKIFHNSKYDISMFLNLGIVTRGQIWDTMIMIQLIDEEFECNMPSGATKRSKRLKDLAFHFLGNDAHELEDLVDEYRRIMALNRGLSKEDISYLDVQDQNLDLMKDYAVADTDFTYKLFDIFYAEMGRQALFEPYLVDIKATYGVVAVERQGMKVDIDLMKHDEKRLEKILRDNENRVYQLIGREFNINSSIDIVEVYKELGVEWHWQTDKEEWDTSKPVLKQFILPDDYEDPITVEIKKQSELAKEILLNRKASKILGTYIQGIYPFIQADGKVHTSFWVTSNDFNKGGTKTGRLSSSDPNFQNIPKKPIKLEGVEFNCRAYYVADDDYILVFKDADQEEYRMLAHYGNDEHFKEMVFKNYDIHSGTASMLFGVPYEEVSDDLRSKGKTLNFGLVYGLGNASFSKALGHKIDEQLYRGATKYLYANYKPWELPPYDTTKYPKDFILSKVEDDDTICAIEYFFSEGVQTAIKDAVDTKKKYFAQFKGIDKFLKDCKSVAKNRGYVKTWTGRRRHFKDPARDNYKAPNSVIQGGCGDIMKVKLAEAVLFLKPYKSKVLISVHDELGFMIHKDELHLIPKLNDILKDLPFKVPITWGVEVGKNWGNKTETRDLEEIGGMI